MGLALAIVFAVVVIGAAALAAPRLHLPLQLLLVVVGVLLAFIPGLPEFRLDGNVVLDGVLPPLLYSAAVRTSLVDLKRGLWVVLALAIGPVLLTAFAVAGVLHAVLPAVGIAAALALGAAVAPPDAVAATSLGRSVGMPRRVTELLEDESLLNDPTALVLQAVAITALTGVVSPLQVGGDLVLAVGAGIASGLVFGWLVGFVRKRITDPILSTLFSFAAPYIAFLPAQAVGGSGVLAVVLSGLIAAQQQPFVTTPQVRIAQSVNWRTISFALENGVFLLIGLQLPGILRKVGGLDLGLGTIVGACALVLATVIVARFAFVFAMQGVSALLRRRHRLSPPETVLLGWVGMRGVVTLAAVFLLPGKTPLLPLLQLAAFVVVGGTLLLQGLTAGPLVRLFRLHGPDPAEDALEFAALMDRMVAAGAKRLDQDLTGQEPGDLVQALRARNAAQSAGAWERLGGRGAGEPPTAQYRRLRSAMLQAQRDVVVRERDVGKLDPDVLRQAMARIDQEQATYDSGSDLSVDREDELVAPRREMPCEHLAAAPLAVKPGTPGECVDCVREGTHWVHLRTCLTCGHVGCCDSSERKHATGHFHDTRHPVMRSAEPGEAWRWCYVDDLLG